MKKFPQNVITTIATNKQTESAHWRKKPENILKYLLIFFIKTDKILVMRRKYIFLSFLPKPGDNATKTQGVTGSERE